MGLVVVLLGLSLALAMSVRRAGPAVYLGLFSAAVVSSLVYLILYRPGL